MVGILAGKSGHPPPDHRDAGLRGQLSQRQGNQVCRMGEGPVKMVRTYGCRGRVNRTRSGHAATKAHAEVDATQSAAKVQPDGAGPLGRCVPHKALHITVVQPCLIWHDRIEPYPS